MWPFEGKHGRKVKRLIVDYVLEPLIPKRRLESYLVFWARLVHRARKPFVIAITGSVGKSTTTAMIAAVLGQPEAGRMVGPTGYTRDNMNDDWGLSATLLRFESFLHVPWAYVHRFAFLLLIPLRALRVVISRYPKIMVLECGAGSTTNFQRLVTIAPPDISVVTTIGVGHLEIFGTLEGLVQAKGELIRAVSPTGVVVLGAEHDYVSQLENMARAPVLRVRGKGTELSRNITRAVCRHIGIPAEVVESALRDFKSPEARLNRLDLPGMTVIDDTWNANPLSMKLGLDTLAEIAGPQRRRLAILGYMAELGEQAPSYHEEVGAYARSRADVLIGVAELSRHYNPDYWFDSCEACVTALDKLVRTGDCLFVKGSHSARMWKVVEKLREIAATRQDARCRA